MADEHKTRDSQPRPSLDAALSIVRRATKRTCSEWPCNHTNCNRRPSGCVNTASEPVAAAVADAFRTAGCMEWAAAVMAAGVEIERREKDYDGRR